MEFFKFISRFRADERQAVVDLSRLGRLIRPARGEINLSPINLQHHFQCQAVDIREHTHAECRQQRLRCVESGCHISFFALRFRL